MRAHTALAVITLATLASAALLSVSATHHPDEPDTTRYCERVEDWRTDERRGLMPDQRRGWPDWRGVCGTEDDNRCGGGE